MRPVCVFDSEVYTNWTLFLFRNVETRETFSFEHPMDLPRLRHVIKTHRLITFNGIGYDIPILMLALKGADAARLKYASNRIIQQHLKPWNFEKEFDVKLDPPGLDHVDLMEVAPMKGSLKVYGGRMHSRYIQDLPIDHTKILDETDKATLRTYCSNDLETTTDLYRSLKVQLELREDMSKTYGIDLRSKSDAQISEAVVKSEVEKVVGHKIQKPGPLSGNQYQYTVQPWMRYQFFNVLDTVRNAWFIVNNEGSVIMPKEIAALKLSLGRSTFRMGIGGLHSTEEKQIVKEDEDHVVMDFDVTSYYPSIVLNQGLYPEHIGPAFLTVYKELIQRRLNAKIRANEIKKEIANIKQRMYNLENEKKEPNVSSSSSAG